MKYKDYSSNRFNGNGSKKAPNRQLLDIGVKVLGAIVLIIVAVSGFKFLVRPIIGAGAKFLDESSTAISYMVNKGSVRQDEGITNTLLIGVDRREYLQSSELTDTLILSSYNHETQRVVMLSIPRDLWIAESGTKINGVFSLQGLDELKSIISDKFGVPIHYYVLVGFEGFTAAIDAVDGIDVYVEREFDDYRYPRPGYENAAWNERWQHVHFDQGWQHMDGETALIYSRSRHAMGPEGSDFARAERQQNVVLAFKEKVMSSETFFNLDRLRNLYLTLSENVQTDVELGELPLFYQMARQISGKSSVETFVLETGNGDGGHLYVPDPGRFGGAYVLIPREGWPEVQEYARNVLYGLEAEGAVAGTSDTDEVVE